MDWKIPESRIDEIIADSERIEMDVFGCCTVVVLKLPNGYTLVEKAGTIDPAEYNPALGRDICMRRLKDKVWELEGYVQKGRFASTAKDAEQLRREIPVKPTRAAID